jgi:hypothetical protein
LLHINNDIWFYSFLILRLNLEILWIHKPKLFEEKNTKPPKPQKLIKPKKPPAWGKKLVQLKPCIKTNA